MNSENEYTYTSDYVIIIVTANSEEQADEIFKHVVKKPSMFRKE